MPLTLDQSAKVAHLNIRKEGPETEKHLMVDLKLCVPTRCPDAQRRGNRVTTAPLLLDEATTGAAVGTPVDRRVMPQLAAVRGAYADPPYLGCGVKHYGTRHAEAAEYDDPTAHRRLVERLCDEFDCWALSLHEPSLRVILPMCPDDVRVGTWVKPFAAFKKNVTRAWTWEPVIFRFSAARPRLVEQPTWRDHVSAPIAMRKGFPGAKPDAFSFWIFEGLNLQPDDEFCDVFPGSGAVGDAWQRWKNRKAPEQLELLGHNDASNRTPREAGSSGNDGCRRSG